MLMIYSTTVQPTRAKMVWLKKWTQEGMAQASIISGSLEYWLFKNVLRLKGKTDPKTVDILNNVKPGLELLENTEV